MKSEVLRLLEQKVLLQAHNLGITQDGPTPLQHLDVLEFHFARAINAVELWKQDRTSGNQAVAAEAISLCLFDLIVQAHFQNSTLADCISEGEPFVSIRNNSSIEGHLLTLRTSVQNFQKGDHLTLTIIALVYACLSDASSACLKMTPEQCLVIAGMPL